MFNRINGYFEEINGNKYLTLVSINESEEKIRKYEELRITKIWDLIRSVTKKSDDHDEKHMKINFDSHNELPLNKTIKIAVMVIVIRAIFYENNKYCPQVVLDECLYKIQKLLYYDRIEVSEGIDVNKISTSKECDVCHYWYFLNYSFMFQPDVCNRCHGLLMMSVNLSDIAILNINGSDYRCIVSLISKNKAIKLLQKADLTEKSGTLWIFFKKIFLKVSIKTPKTEFSSI